MRSPPPLLPPSSSSSSDLCGRRVTNLRYACSTRRRRRRSGNTCLLLSPPPPLPPLSPLRAAHNLCCRCRRSSVLAAAHRRRLRLRAHAVAKARALARLRRCLSRSRVGARAQICAHSFRALCAFMMFAIIARWRATMTRRVAAAKRVQRFFFRVVRCSLTFALARVCATFYRLIKRRRTSRHSCRAHALAPRGDALFFNLILRFDAIQRIASYNRERKSGQLTRTLLRCNVLQTKNALDCCGCCCFVR